MKPLEQKDLLQMLTYRRPANSKTEAEFIKRYIDPIPGMYADKFGNRILQTDADAKVIIACHTDTVHRHHGRQKIKVSKGIAHLPKFAPFSNCLGADDTAGIYAALRMIQAGVKATFIFHRAEEIGGRGSQWLADCYPKWLESFDICLSLDRRGKTDIITHQWGGRTASTLFAWSLADALAMEHTPTEGIFTDSANYMDLIAECSNVSIGYEHEHTTLESLDLDYLETIIGKLIAVDWSALEVARNKDAYDWEDELVEDDTLAQIEDAKYGYLLLEDEPEDVWLKPIERKAGY